MSLESLTLRLSLGFTMRGASTDPHKEPPAPKFKEGPQLVKDARYPTLLQNGLTSSFEQGKKFHSPNFVVSPSGFTSPVPKWAIGPFETRSPGVEFRYGSGGHDFDKATSSVRVMDASGNQGKRTVYENDRGQIVDPKTGKTSLVKGHFPHDRKVE